MCRSNNINDHIQTVHSIKYSLMKNLKFTLCFLILACAFYLNAQNVPQKFKYQGVAKFNGEIVTGDISLQISILEDSPVGTLVFQERHAVKTNGEGVFATEVGNGEFIQGTINSTDWASGRYYLKVELDPAGGNEYVDLGWSQLVSVPYALHAGTVDDKDDADADPTNELQNLGFDELTNELTLSNGNKVTLPSPGTDDQTLTLDGTTLSIEDGNSLNLIEAILIVDNDQDPENELQNWLDIPDVPEDLLDGDDVEDDDADPTNELQHWDNFPGIPEDLLDGDNVDDDDPDPKNELQQMQWIINNTLWSDEWILQLYHVEINPDTEEQTIVIDTSLTIPDSDPINEIQQIRIMPDPDNSSNSKLEILRKICIGDSTIWTPFEDPVIIPDTDPENEIQTITFDPQTGKLTLSGSTDVDLSNLKSPWILTPSGDCVEYDGKATSTSFETPLGGVLIDDSGVSRYHTPTGDNVSNLCLEDQGNIVYGKFELLNNNEIVSIYQSCIHRSGIVNILGPNGNHNVFIGHEAGLPNNGLISVADQNNVERVGMYVNNFGQGVSFANLKQFRMDHPADPTKEIRYASLEGPEAGAYERGTARLEDGEIFVPFSDHFREVINSDYMTVMLTPLSANTLGLAVIEKTSSGFRVKELMDGAGNFEFDWEVKSVRKTYENYQPVQEKSALQYHPNIIKAEK